MGVGPLSLPRRPFKLLSIPLFTPHRPPHTHPRLAPLEAPPLLGLGR